ncbi:hypothetical protein [Paraburkholderia fungorum]|jgi:hypothetical protein|uniref:Uncharacterized protein n=1 Tax=Paraburkholderia fungorum TaxID=134537 RepID=A0AAW3V5U5_9BURK|nr:hypothetical protein [Paraburkholderia fungorum]AJZ56075.1 hypothetical protein OI25_8129 [Paraburkholderia fungorum]MBB4516432.1 hypothetical protein [Paraburkholderia fungorum]MBB5545311.1 hypothetical protein [Paraburkholderia fungorum]MBB6205095.1 hypothetical protein [Paraburkholderia fungorum]MBU7440702.1 hypothetical protein [Paraburkholderia fungorum]
MGAFLLILAIAYIVYRLMTRKSEGVPVEQYAADDDDVRGQDVQPTERYRWVAPHDSTSINTNASDDGHWML